MIYFDLAYCWLIRTIITGVSTHPQTDIQKGWYAGVIIPLSTGYYCVMFIDCLYISVTPGQLCLYQSVMDFVYTPVIDFSVYTSRT